MSPPRCKAKTPTVWIPNSCPFFFNICLCVVVGSSMEFCIPCSVALKVTDLIGELPGNCSRVLAYCCQAGQGARWQRWEGSPFSCPALIKGPDPGVDRLATGLQPQWVSLDVCGGCTQFILKQDIRLLRIHPAPLQRAAVLPALHDQTLCVRNCVLFSSFS